MPAGSRKYTDKKTLLGREPGKASKVVESKSVKRRKKALKKA